MSIVLNEYEWAENAIKNRNFGKKPSETLLRIAKYYLQNGYTKKDTATLLRDYIIRCDPDVSLEKWTNLIDWSVGTAVKYKPIMIDGIAITNSELSRIKELPGKQCQRLAFTLLCIAKYAHEAFSNDYWVNTPDSEIMKMANINTSIKRQSAMFGQLKDDGMIRFSKRIDNLSVQVLFVDDESEVAVVVTDCRNLGYQYNKLCGGSYYECQCCGLTVKHNEKSTKTEKYCKACADLMRRKQNAESVSRLREGFGTRNYPVS